MCQLNGKGKEKEVTEVVHPRDGDAVLPAPPARPGAPRAEHFADGEAVYADPRLHTPLRDTEDRGADSLLKFLGTADGPPPRSSGQS